jgi:hypothetical protein
MADAPDCRGDPLSIAGRSAVEHATLLLSTVRHWFYHWRDNGLWLTIDHVLLMTARAMQGRESLTERWRDRQPKHQDHGIWRSARL